MSDRTQRIAAFTLVEVLVAVTLSGVILAGVLATNLQVIRSGIRITQYAEMETQVRRGLDRLGYDLRIAKDIKWNNASSITLAVPTGTETQQLTYAWLSDTETFFLVAGANSAVTTGRNHLVRGIPVAPDGTAGLTFARFDRDGNAATTDTATKRIQVTMVLGRSSHGAPAATDSTISATYTMRNKVTN